MAVLREIRAKARQIIPSVLAVCVMGYFAYHIVQGDRGLRALSRIQHDLAVARVTQAWLATERARLERDVDLLRPDGLDPDMLGERARVLLNYGLEDEYVVLLPDVEVRQ